MKLSSGILQGSNMENIIIFKVVVFPLFLQNRTTFFPVEWEITRIVLIKYIKNV
jgi:hypothetical protein